MIYQLRFSSSKESALRCVVLKSVSSVLLKYRTFYRVAYFVYNQRWVLFGQNETLGARNVKKHSILMKKNCRRFLKCFVGLQCESQLFMDFIFLRDVREQTTRIEAQNIASREKTLTYSGRHSTHSGFTLKILKELFLTTV